MADLTPHYGEIRQTAYSLGFAKADLKALPAGLPDKSQLLGTFQAIEDWAVADFASVKADMETALGQTMTNALAKKLMAAYFQWKINDLLG